MRKLLLLLTLLLATPALAEDAAPPKKPCINELDYTKKMADEFHTSIFVTLEGDAFAKFKSRSAESKDVDNLPEEADKAMIFRSVASKSAVVLFSNGCELTKAMLSSKLIAELLQDDSI